MFDESLLDSPEGLARADSTGLLLGAAAAGARVRTAAREAAESGLTGLRPDGRPRSVLIAGPGSAPDRIADLLGSLAACPVLPVPTGGTAPTTHDRRWTLPGWAGPYDLLLLVSHDGTETGLTLLIEQAYRHGCAVSGVAPAGTPLTEALQQARGLALPFAQPSYREDTGKTPGEAADPAAFWAMLTPLLALTDRLGLLTAPPHSIQIIADRLDDAAARFGPAADTYRNPAKTLTAELADAFPLLWSEGPATDPVARRFAALLTSRAGRPALAAALPEAVTAHAALLDGPRPSGGEDLTDFFRDRVEEPDTLRPRIVLLREPGATPTLTAHDAAAAHGTPLSAIDAPAGTTAESLAELLALTDFASVYLALATGEGRST